MHNSNNLLLEIDDNIDKSIASFIQSKIITEQYLDDLIEKKICVTEALGCTKEQPLVFTNGVFDVLHKGHLTYLAQAKNLGYKLIIGLNSDLSTKMLAKGEDRPINSHFDRQIMLASLLFVDYVVIFEEKTPIELLKKIKPHIYVKGGDYTINSLPETPIVQSWGGIVEILSFVQGYSTTSILCKIRKGS
ncbi:MAG: hypothetical protein RLZZ210_1440 [Pseudomonadota bacterium]|jgi:rfaE bifunctional protein nucleotidyltransferase chain/domain